MRRVHAFAILLFAAASGLLHAQSYEALTNRAAEADVRGKTRLAARRYLAAADAATLPAERVAALLNFIHALRGGVSNAMLDDATAAEIEKAYGRALDDASGLDSFKVHNDYGVFLLDRNRAQDALNVFAAGRGDIGEVHPRVAARYLHNYGLAQSRSDHGEDALMTFWEALDKDPFLAATNSAALSLLITFGPERGSTLAIERIQSLLQNDQLVAAEKLLAAVMDSAMDAQGWHSQRQATEVLPELVVTLLVKRQTPQSAIIADWQPRLKHLMYELSDDPRRKIQQLLVVFEGRDLPMSFDGNVEQHFTYWKSEEQRRGLSVLLLRAGDAMVDEEPKRAAERYIAAWKLDRRNVDALTSLAELLTYWDDENVPKLRAQLIDNTWDAKLGAIASGDDAAELRLHMVLGSIFDDEQKWEPAENPRTSSFQYIAALAAYERLRTKPDAPIYPGVYANAALSFERLGQKDEAWHAYVNAADANVQTGDYESAARMLERCAELGWQPTDADQDRVRALRTEIDEQLQAPVTDGGIASAVRDRLSADPAIDASKLDVDVEAGSVVLKGVVGTQQEIDDAKLAVEKTVGVKEVKVEVTLTPPR
ncbi:MAG TPA: BON domain-containing protein [Thermoanaerobaculia bacterium]|nr:BON domain-containing protein [Thermoanaerobaculia bacterium]